MLSLFRKLFTKDVDRQVDAIFDDEIAKPLQDSAKSARSLATLLKKNGVTLQIYIATGGDKRGH